MNPPMREVLEWAQRAQVVGESFRRDAQGQPGPADPQDISRLWFGGPAVVAAMRSFIGVGRRIDAGRAAFPTLAVTGASVTGRTLGGGPKRWFVRRMSTQRKVGTAALRGLPERGRGID